MEKKISCDFMILQSEFILIIFVVRSELVSSLYYYVYFFGKHILHKGNAQLLILNFSCWKGIFSHDSFYVVDGVSVLFLADAWDVGKRLHFLNFLLVLDSFA